VFTRHGERVGHVGHSAGPSVARRLLGRGAVLGTMNGAPAWIERNDPAFLQAKAKVSAVPLEKSLRSGKGSIGEPHAPKAHVRPRRG